MAGRRAFMNAGRLDVAAARIAKAIAASGVPGPEAGTVEEARASFRASRAALAPQVPEVALVRDIAVPGSSGTIPVRLYRGLRTREEDKLPVLLFFHSGGWTSGDLDTHDNACRAIATVAHIAVVAVDYRLAPEHKFPAATEDAADAYSYIRTHAAELGLDATRIAVGGDSAGANLAAVLTHQLKDAHGSQPVAQVLMYPATDFAADTPSLREFATGPTLTKASLDWFAGHYLPSEEDRLDWRASPLRAANFTGLPQTLLVTCGFDPLRDEGKAYGEALEAGGVVVRHRYFPGQIHGFLTMGGVIPETTILIGEVAAYLHDIFYRDIQ